jgi:tetratricopeptide (TPR) repeat protein
VTGVLLAVRIVVAILILVAPSWADEDSTRYVSLFTPGPFQDTILTGINLTANDKFAEAESLFVDVGQSHPHSPIGPLFAAAAIHAHMLDTESPARFNEFETWLTLAERRAKEWRDADPESGEPEFILGAALGYDAVYESRWGGWFAALKKGLRAKNRFADALKRDSTLIDAYLGIGNYNYWKSVKTDFINWLPIVADDRRKGLDQLRRVTTEGTLSKAAASVSLCWALMHDGDFTSALAQADTLGMQHPDAKTPLWIKAYASYGLYRWDDALKLYGELERRILADGPGNYYNLIDCAYFEARCYYDLGRWSDAMNACHKALAYPAPREIQKRQDDKLDDLRKLQKELKEMVAN